MVAVRSAVVEAAMPVPFLEPSKGLAAQLSAVAAKRREAMTAETFRTWSTFAAAVFVSTLLLSAATSAPLV